MQFTERCLLQDGIQIHRQYFFPAVYLLVRAGVRDHVRIRDHLAADIEENASTVAYANKPVTLIWGIIWGKLIFDEKITWSMILGACIIFAGIYLVTSGDKEENGGERI